MDTQYFLKKLEKLVHRNQQEMAELVGVTHVTYDRWRRGHASPSHLARRRLAQIATNPEKFTLPRAMRPTMKHLSLSEARAQLRINLFRIEQFPAGTPPRFIAQFRKDWVEPLERLIEALSSGRTNR